MKSGFEVIKTIQSSRGAKERIRKEEDDAFMDLSSEITAWEQHFLNQGVSHTRWFLLLNCWKYFTGDTQYFGALKAHRTLRMKNQTS